MRAVGQLHEDGRRPLCPGVSKQDLPTLLLRGLDSLYISHFFDLERSNLDFNELAFQKERIREARLERLAEIQLGTERFALMPYGKHPYAYILSNEAFELRLGERLSPSCHVQFFSQFLWQCGLDDLCKRFTSWADSMRLQSKLPEVISRADWAFDYSLAAIDFGADDFVSRARKDAIHRENGNVQTFTRGRGDFVLRVYDKVAEIEQQSEKFWFYDLWGQTRDVWRIEFQVRRARLHKAGIDTLDDLRSLQSDLLHELAANHTTLRDPSKDTNRARWPLHPLWKALLDDIASLEQSGLVRVNDPRGTLNMRVYYQARSLYGSLKGLAALHTEREDRERPMSLAEILAALPAILHTHHNEVVWYADVRKRLTALRLGQW
jgi:hypothetical protein